MVTSDDYEWPDIVTADPLPPDPECGHCGMDYNAAPSVEVRLRPGRLTYIGGKRPRLYRLRVLRADYQLLHGGYPFIEHRNGRLRAAVKALLLACGRTVRVSGRWWA